MLTLSVLDLSLTIGQTYQISNNLCDVAMKYLKLCGSLDNTEYANFFLKIYQLFYESKSNMSMTTMLCDIRIPLSVKDWRDSNVFWDDFGNNYCAFNDAERIKTDVEKQPRDNNRFLGLQTIKKMSAMYNSDRKYLQNVYSHLQLVHTIIPDTSSECFFRLFNLTLCANIPAKLFTCSHMQFCRKSQTTFIHKTFYLYDTITHYIYIIQYQ